MRDPSIHITESQLALVLKGLLYVDKSPIEWDYNKLAQAIVYHSKSLSANHRVIIVSNNKLEKKANIILSASKKDAVLLADIIYYIRRKKRHRGITKLDQSHKDWGQLKKLTKCCIEFCNEFQIKRRQGFIIYIQMGLDNISSLRSYINKMINMQERISTDYEYVKILEDDDEPRETLKIHDLYVSMISNKTGIPENYTKNPKKYINFLKIRKITDEMDIPIDIYLKAQFFGLAWADSYPEPLQLVGDKAIERLNKYMFKNKLKQNKKQKVRKDGLNVLLRIKADEKNKD